MHATVPFDSSVRDLGSQTLELALVASMLANLVREVGDEALLALRYLERVGGEGRGADLADGDDTEGGDDIVAARVRVVLDTREHHGLAQELNTW